MTYHLNKEDELRHIKLWKYFGLNFLKREYDLNHILNLLEFERAEDFFYWLIIECDRFMFESAHNYIRVGSPHNLLLRDLYKYFNSKYNNALTEIAKADIKRIEAELSDWNSYVSAKHELNRARIAESERREQERHINAVREKAEKATTDIFNAIRRKDIKAIIALRKKGADINKICINGISPLQYALQLGDEHVINTLCRNYNDT